MRDGMPPDAVRGEVGALFHQHLAAIPRLVEALIDGAVTVF